MADYYTKYSFILPTENLDPEAVADWVEQIKEEMNSDYWFETYNGTPAVTVTDDGVWVWDDGADGVEAAIQITQSFLKQFSIDGGVFISWAETCSKPRLDGFGGGGAVITRDDALVVTSFDVMAEAGEAGIRVISG